MKERETERLRETERETETERFRETARDRCKALHEEKSGIREDRKTEGGFTHQLILLQPPLRENSCSHNWKGTGLAATPSGYLVWLYRFGTHTLCGPGLRLLVNHLKLLPSSVWMSTVCHAGLVALLILRC